MTCLNKEKEIELSLYNDVGTLASYNKYIEATKGDISVIYMDNAATTMHKPKTVIDAVVAAMSSMGNAGRGANEASLSASRIIYDTRERLAKLFGAENPKQIVFTMNSTESLNIAIKGLIEPGDHVITTMLEHNSVLRPLYEMEERGAKLTIIKADKQGNFSLEDMEAAITPKTKLLVLPFSNNPTGAIMEKSDLEKIAEVIKKHDIFVLSDEIYSELTYLEKHVTIASLPGMWERTIVINGFSKSHAMTGWRLGYACGPRVIIEQMLKIHQFAIMCAPYTSQYAGVEALKNGDEDVAQMGEEYNGRRRYLLHRFKEMGLSCFEPFGAFYVFPCISEFGMTSEQFATELLNTEKLAVVPGTAFGDCGEGFIRISYAYSLENLKEAMNRMEAFITGLRKQGEKQA